METKQITILVVLSLGAMIFMSGCAKPRRSNDRQVRRSSHLVFNPSSTRIALADTPRADWPSTEAYEEYGEDIRYQETILDWQGRSGFGVNSDDQYYRRFQSTRKGRAGR